MSDFNPNINFEKSNPQTPSPTPHANPKNEKIHTVALPILQKPIQERPSALSIASPQSSQINSFEHITRYLPRCKELLKQTEGKEKEVATLCQDLQEGNWAKILKKGALKTLPTYALRAFHGGKITGEQFTTLLIYWSAFSQLPPDQIMIRPIFDANGKVDPEVKAWIEGTIGNELGDVSHLDSKMELFFTKMKKNPPSEQSLLYALDSTYLQTKFMLDVKRAGEQASITKKDPLEFLAHYEDTICDSINRAEFNVLHLFPYLDEEYLMIPSLSMMQALLDAHGKENTVIITPVIGLSSREDIRANGLNSTRDMALAFPGFPLPQEADLLSAPLDIDFIYHDFYHSVIANTVPEKWKKAFIECSDSILALAREESDEDIKNFLNEFYERLIDLEHPPFRDSDPQPLLPDAEKFFVSVSNQVENTLSRLFPIKAYEASTDADYFKRREGHIATQLDKIGKSNIIGKLAQKLHEKGFCSNYGIKKDDLSRRQKPLKKGEESRDLAYQLYKLIQK